MKKKMTAVLLAGALLVASSLTTFAAEVEQWSYDDDDVANVYTEDGWISMNGVGVDIWHPADWKEVEPENDNVMYMAQNEAGTAFVAVSKSPAAMEDGEDATIEQVAEVIGDLDGIEIDEKFYNVNGLGCCAYISDQDLTGMAFLGDSGTVYTVEVGPTSEADSAEVALAIYKSVSPTEE